MFNVIDQYNSFIENNFIKKNVDQIKFLKQANNVWSSYSKTKLFFKDKIFEGIYLYGQVGTGKTFLLNLFYQNSKIGIISKYLRKNKFFQGVPYSKFES